MIHKAHLTRFGMIQRDQIKEGFAYTRNGWQLGQPIYIVRSVGRVESVKRVRIAGYINGAEGVAFTPIARSLPVVVDTYLKPKSEYVRVSSLNTFIDFVPSNDMKCDDYNSINVSEKDGGKRLELVV